jgi:D-3-phosphoglycerate dehydrogenase
MRILANDGIAAAGKERLIAAGHEVDENNRSAEQLLEEINEFDVLLVRSATKVRKDLIDKMERVKLIGRGGVGLDNIDVDLAKAKGIEVMNTPAASSLSVAELVFAHLYGMCRFLPELNRRMPNEGVSEFKSLKKKASKGIELRGKTLGIIGFGRIGQEAARIALGNGMKVLAADAFIPSAKIDVSLHPEMGTQSMTVEIQTISTEEVLRNSDFITLHVPGQDTPVIGEAELAMMKEGAGLVNAARGGVVDEAALKASLESGKLAFAALDVFKNEPPHDDVMLTLDRVSLSPHIGAATKEAQDRVGLELADKIIAFFAA